jgi:hypothetical protein
MHIEKAAMALILAASLATIKPSRRAVARCRARSLRIADHVRQAGQVPRPRVAPQVDPRVASDQVLVMMARACRICSKCPGVKAPDLDA